MDDKEEKINQESRLNFKGIFKYISTVVSWTIFCLLIIIAALLIYYYISVRLYATKGEKYAPKFSVYTIVTPSMEPTISVLDVIVNVKVNDIEDVKINDVITFISTWNINYGKTITHRVIGTKRLDNGDICLITRGDNNTSEDGACVEEKNLIGVTKAVIPSLGKLQQLLSSKMGWLLLILMPALYILVKDVFKIVGLAKDMKKDKNASKNPIYSDDNKDELIKESIEKYDEKIVNDNTANISHETNSVVKKKRRKSKEFMRQQKSKDIDN